MDIAGNDYLSSRSRRGVVVKLGGLSNWWKTPIFNTDRVALTPKVGAAFWITAPVVAVDNAKKSVNKN